MDIILWNIITKFCYVYIVDIIVFSLSLEEHTAHLMEFIKTLKETHFPLKNHDFMNSKLIF